MHTYFRLNFVLPRNTDSCFDYLSCQLAEGHFQRLPHLLKKGHIRINGEPLNSDQALEAGAQITVDLPGHIEEAVDTCWERVWENDELMVVNKPALLPVSRTTRNLYHTLISLIRRETPYDQAQLLHRLDTETSGLLVIAKDRQADKKWKPRLKQLLQRKIYHAWVYGEPDWENQLLECQLAEKEGSKIRSQVYVVDEDGGGAYVKPRWSKTRFQVLQRVQNRSLIECELFTGRKHQIRTKLAFLGYPIVGDKIYSLDGFYYLKRLNQPLESSDYQALGSHAHQLLSVALELLLDDETVFIEIPGIGNSKVIRGC